MYRLPEHHLNPLKYLIFFAFSKRHHLSFLFKHCGSIFFAPLDDSEALMDEAINLGADDVIINDDKSIEIITAPNDFTKINEGLEKLGFKKELAELTMKAEN